MADRDKHGRFGKGNQLAKHSGGGRKSLAAEADDITLGQKEPKTEMEVRERFRILNEVYGFFHVLLSQESFPDFVLQTRDGHRVRAEVETLSAHFKMHQHDPAGCDLIICWRHNWSGAPIPVLPIMHFWYAYNDLALIPMDRSELWHGAVDNFG